MRTLGIDLAAAPERTAACELTWTAGRASGILHPPPLDDDRLLELMRGADHIGIDCPLGWPVPFVEAVVAHQSGKPWPGRGGPDGAGFRRRLCYRRTDEIVAQGEKTRPLSVSTDRIGVVALRCALILDRYAPGGLDRDGSAAIAEVYPAAALKRYELTARGYKRPKNVAMLRRNVEALRKAAPWLDIEDWSAAERGDDTFDAVICALVARAVAVGSTAGPCSTEDARLARVEGWIHVPIDGLDALPAAPPHREQPDGRRDQAEL